MVMDNEKPRRSEESLSLRQLSRKVAIGDGCWEFTGTPHPNGYGYFTVAKKRRSTHRAIYELLVGPVPAGLVLDHLCRNRSCARPSHLEPVTQRVNVLRGEGLAAKQARQTHCKRGHVFDAANTYHHPRRANGRHCRRCNAAATVKYKLGKARGGVS